MVCLAGGVESSRSKACRGSGSVSGGREVKCMNCGKTPWQHGITLLRQNPKGETGIWACEACNGLPVLDDLAQPLAEIQHALTAKEPKQ